MASHVDTPTAIQFYLPAEGENSAELLENLETKVATMNHDWWEFVLKEFQWFLKNYHMNNSNNLYQKKLNQLYLGLNKLSAEPETLPIFQRKR